MAHSPPPTDSHKPQRRPKISNISLTDRPAWKALRAMRMRCAARPSSNCSRRSQSRNAHEHRGVFVCSSTIRRTGTRMRRSNCSCSLLRNAAYGSASKQYLSGEKIDVAEVRAVLHVLCERPSLSGSLWMAKTWSLKCTRCSEMSAFAHHVRSGQWRGRTGERVKNVVDIGIGGSDLGPVMRMRLNTAQTGSDLPLRLKRRPERICRGHARSARRRDTLPDCFEDLTTLETMTNAHSARDGS